jgi:hypothetical protein
VIALPADATITPRAGVWRVEAAGQRALRIEAAAGAAPVLDGTLDVQAADRSSITLRGLLVAGGVEATGSGELSIEHSTLVPHRDAGGLRLGAMPNAAGPRVSLQYAITGHVTGRANVHASATIVDGGIRLDGGNVHLEDVTVLHGPVVADAVLADTCIFTEPVTARHSGDRAGYLRCCSAPPTAHPPRFTSTVYGEPAYGQLALDCPEQVARGGAAGGEMGALNWLAQPDRFTRLPIILHELLPVDVAASITFRT